MLACCSMALYAVRALLRQHRLYRILYVITRYMRVVRGLYDVRESCDMRCSMYERLAIVGLPRKLPQTMYHDDILSRELVDSAGRDLEQILQHLSRVLAELSSGPLRPAPPALETRAQRGNFDSAADRAHVDVLELSARDVVLVVDHVVDGVDRTYGSCRRLAVQNRPEGLRRDAANRQAADRRARVRCRAPRELRRRRSPSSTTQSFDLSAVHTTRTARGM